VESEARRTRPQATSERFPRGGERVENGEWRLESEARRTLLGEQIRDRGYCRGVKMENSDWRMENVRMEIYSLLWHHSMPTTDSPDRDIQQSPSQPCVHSTQHATSNMHANIDDVILIIVSRPQPGRPGAPRRPGAATPSSQAGPRNKQYMKPNKGTIFKTNIARDHAHKQREVPTRY
jgi:hypothetical protein